MAPRQYRIRNWSKFQHYKNRNPPWIKLHVEILSSEDWVSLADASKLLAIACMIVASKNDGLVPDNPDYIQRVAYLEHRPNLEPLIQCGFLEISQADASECLQVLADARPESEKEKEKEAEEVVEAAAADFFEMFFKEMPRPMNRASTKTAYKKALTKGVTEAELVAAAKRYAAECKTYGGPQFILSATSWLEKERWTDFPAKANGKIHDSEDAAFQKRMREKYGYE